MLSIKWSLILIVGGWLVFNQVYQMHEVFHAPRCPKDANIDKSCYKPLFDLGEEVDIFVYLTANERLRWWTEKGFAELQRAPLWNASAQKFGEGIANESTVVPLSLEKLAKVRKNESMLYAHCFLVRSGKKLEDLARASRSFPDPGPPGGALGTDAVHASQYITRLLPYTPRPERKNLLGGGNSSSEEEEEEQDTDPNAPVKKPRVYTNLPGFGRIAVHPSEGLMWVGAIFAVGGFMDPSRPLAVVRMATIFAAARLITLRQEQEQKWEELKRKRARENAEWLSQQEKRIMPHLVPLIRISLGAEGELYDARYGPPLLYKEMVFKNNEVMPIGERDVRYPMVGKRYLPPLSIEHFGVPMRSWRMLDGNTSRPDPEVALEMEVVGMIRYSVMETLKQSIQMYLNVGVGEQDLEDLKNYFFRFPLHILIAMQVIGFLQMFLTTMAFKNDISFFRGRADYSGLSSRSLATDTLQDLIIFLYLYDYEDISKLVLFQIGVSSLIGAWKYVRVARLGIRWAHGLPWVTHNRGTCDIGEEQDTEDIDAKGMRYLKLVLYPLSACWGIYNVYYFSYKSWWSWLVSSLADLAYTFGFINMMPQIFINYKLQSVAHMPWRVMAYKFFNTFIDDVFAFFIMSDHMTKKHRFMTLRDDVVFFIFLYQLWIYKVDYSRPDEFGFVYTDSPEALAESKEKEKLGNGDATKLQADDTDAKVAEASGDPSQEAAQAAAETGPGGSGEEEEEEEEASSCDQEEDDDEEEEATESAMGGKAAEGSASGAKLRKRRGPRRDAI